jgi:hypothetical protein
MKMAVGGEKARFDERQQKIMFKGAGGEYSPVHGSTA